MDYPEYGPMSLPMQIIHMHDGGDNKKHIARVLRQPRAFVQKVIRKRRQYIKEDLRREREAKERDRTYTIPERYRNTEDYDNGKTTMGSKSANKKEE